MYICNSDNARIPNTLPPTNEEILQATTNPSGPLEDLLRKRRRYDAHMNHVHLNNQTSGTYLALLSTPCSIKLFDQLMIYL